MVNTWQKIDQKRIYSGEYKEKEEVKVRRRKVKSQKAKKADAFTHAEGVQYKSQGFYNSEQQKTTKRTTKCKGVKKR